MKYIHYIIASLMRRMKKNSAKSKYLDSYDKSLGVSKPTLCLTHDIDEGYEGNLDKMVELEKKYGVNSTMFLLNMSLPSKKWVNRNKKVDFQLHSNFISSQNILRDKKEVDGLVGYETTINRSHQYVLPSLESLRGAFLADSSYNNWQNITMFNPFVTRQGVVEFPVFPEIPFHNLKKFETVVKLWKEIMSTARKSDGLVVCLTHPTIFNEFGSKFEEFLLTQKGFDVRTLSDVLKEIK